LTDIGKPCACADFKLSDRQTLDSKMEAGRYRDLKLLEKAGGISELDVHMRFPLHAGTNQTSIGSYESDFAYFVPTNGVGKLRVVEDVKGVKTPLYRWKKKHFEAQYGIKIIEITKGRKSRTMRRAR
jgi:hypothetical protein